jgi:hypothetical protein
VLLVPAFLEAGRLTAADIHWAASTPDLVPAGQTEFAQDPVSGYTASDLKDVHGGGDGGQRVVVRLHGAGGENHRGALDQCVAEQGRQLADLVTTGRDTAQAFPLGEQSRAVTERGHQAGQRAHWGFGLSRAR